MFVVIEKFNPESPFICVDEEGNTLLFNVIEKAYDFAANECQDGQIVKLT